MSNQQIIIDALTFAAQLPPALTAWQAAESIPLHVAKQAQEAFRRARRELPACFLMAMTGHEKRKATGPAHRRTLAHCFV